MIALTVPWRPEIKWDTPAGEILQRFLSKLPKNKEFLITVFGSAPLQLGLDPSFLSGDVDIFSDDDFSLIIAQHGLGKGSGGMYIEQTSENIFIVSPSWRDRAFQFCQENVTLTFPHPIDILVAKLKRLEPKDLRAFHLVFSKTGHPTEAELKVALQKVVDMYKPAFDEEDTGGDPFGNTITVWRELYGKEIDVRAEIIIPAQALRRPALNIDTPKHGDELKEYGK